MEKPKKTKFRRTDVHKYSKLGVRRKKKQLYRKSKGRDNKIRLKMKGHLRNVSIGFRTNKKLRGTVNKLNPIRVCNLEELKQIKENQIAIIGKIGAKKKKQIAEYSLEHKINLGNFNPKKFLVNLEDKLRKLKEKRSKILNKKQKKSKEAEKKQKTEDKKEKKIVESKESTKSDVSDLKDDKKQIQTNNYGRGK